jgi:replicative DNA helicase
MDEQDLSRDSEGKVPPHDLGGERVLISALVLTPETFDVLQNVVKPSYCYDPRHRLVCESIWDLNETGQPVDMVSVIRWLEDRKKLQKAGGPQFLAEIVDSSPSIINVESHARSVADKWRLRQLIVECRKTIALVNSSPDGSETHIESLERDLSTIRLGSGTKNLEPVAEIAARHLDVLQEADRRGSHILGTPTGFLDLDAKTAGLNNGDLTIIAGRPAMGKTAFALNIAMFVAAPPVTPEPGDAVAFFSLEMPKEQLAMRIICSQANVDMNALRRGRLSADAWVRLREEVEKLRRMALYIDDQVTVTLSQIRSRVRRLKSEIASGRSRVPAKRLRWVVIDYLQLMEGSRQKGDSREREVAMLTRGLKIMAKEEDIPVAVLSQLNRSVEKDRKEKRPQLSDLRESGAIEQDADNVFFLFRPCMYDKGANRRDAECIVAKQRNGPTDTIHLIFDADRTRFSNKEQTPGGYTGADYEGDFYEFDSSL